MEKQYNHNKTYKNVSKHLNYYCPHFIGHIMKSGQLYSLNCSTTTSNIFSQYPFTSF